MSAESERRIGDVILALENISLAFGGVKALSDVSFDVREHEIRAIIGPNGAGKSSMLNVINGVYHPQLGTHHVPRHAAQQMVPHEAARQGIARTFQNIALFKGMTVLDNIMTGRNLQMKATIVEQAIYFGRAQARGAREPARRSRRSSTSCRSSTSARRRSAACPTACRSASSSRARSRPSPSLLLLDEPMAGMNVEEKQDMCRFILDVNEQFGTTIVLIEHDMGVVMDISDRVVVLDYGRKIGDGTPDEVRANQAVIDAYLGVAH